MAGISASAETPTLRNGFLVRSFIPGVNRLPAVRQGRHAHSDDQRLLLPIDFGFDNRTASISRATHTRARCRRPGVARTLGTVTMHTRALGMARRVWRLRSLPSRCWKTLRPCACERHARSGFDATIRDEYKQRWVHTGHVLRVAGEPSDVELEDVTDKGFLVARVLASGPTARVELHQPLEAQARAPHRQEVSRCASPPIGGTACATRPSRASCGRRAAT